MPNANRTAQHKREMERPAARLSLSFLFTKASDPFAITAPEDPEYARKHWGKKSPRTYTDYARLASENEFSNQPPQ